MIRKLAIGTALGALSAGGAFAQDIDVKLGVLNDRSGVYADLSGEGSVVAARMAVEDFGAAEKGLNVEIISADHQNKPDIGSNIARQWYDEEGVNAILDVPTSSVALAVADITAEKGGVLIDSGAGSTSLTREQCRPTTIHWTYDTAALAAGTGKEMTNAGGKKWFFLTADYAFGHSLEENTAAVVEENGGEVVGTIDVPFPASDFSSFLLQAQGSGADVIGLANAGGDTVNAIKQAAEFGITQAGQQLAALLFFITDVNALGAQTAQGLSLTEAFYWDQTDETREWSARFEEQHGAKPTMVHAGVYSGTMHYLQAVAELGSTEGEAVAAKMKETKFDDPLFGEGYVRADGRVIHDMYLFQVKTPDESTGEWDLYKQIAQIDGEEAFLPMLEECDFSKQ
ncbi:ABC transporter permease (plasmid) [Pacificitalea manganoxidans]|uniref:ABC transporter permease n=1 Tax=Pacificitalea manganoxidans TaxID=1411902 RepID=A0A291M4S5_9RHOB|nr:ABC transporter substrate-binding protein [Pacificitalea manganoxidans]ATI43902.1 ABC transporter permease [Pacificitalea manganoxidans]MAQ45230.1 ABC transporter permease [Actibacterium sp.]MDR6310189.1 branched-chain amino acid transport system substrate-binding protein [Pacificitalea manganoxidans]OWU67450.1 ABC transporter permease [Roseovarius sp. 22II1-1F6A]